MHAPSLHRYAPITLCLLTALLITGCASTEQMQQVEHRVDNQSYTLNQVRDRMDELASLMDSLTSKQTNFQSQQQASFDHFTNAYSPKVRAELDANLAQSQAHRDKVLELKNASQGDRLVISSLLQTSREQLAIIKQNRKESDVVNVVNQFEKMIAEFNKLNRHWDQTVTDFKTESAKHSAAVTSSTQAVNVALAEATNARSAAEKAEVYAQRVHSYDLQIIEMQRNLQRAQREVDRLERELDNEKRNNHRLANDIRQLEHRINSHSH
ncbi:MAG: hypothetical protein CMJ19_11085 [Phycisphaeraceae bacterium]|nr:hypothetical protein [Phycisphaeraceae bacterium]